MVEAQDRGLCAYIHDADTDAQKKTLFDAVNSGRVPILLGSAEKMGAGTNVAASLGTIRSRLQDGNPPGSLLDGEKE
jgi:hypothetical protein